MNGFLDAALSFPAVLFSFLLLVVIGYWLLVLFGAVELDLDGGAADAALDGATGGTGGGDGSAGILVALGFGGLPMAVVGSLLIALSWFASLAGTVLLGDRTPFVLTLLVLLAALVVGWLVTRLLAVPLRRLFPDGPGASRTDFVGRICVIRTGRVTAAFGQAEVTAPDGSSAIVQVRQAGTDDLRMGSTALIYDYDTEGEYFWVQSLDPETLNGGSAGSGSTRQASGRDLEPGSGPPGRAAESHPGSSGRTAEPDPDTRSRS